MLSFASPCLFFHVVQLRIHDSQDVDFYVLVASGPIIEGCSGLRFSPSRLQYPEHDQHLKASTVTDFEVFFVEAYLYGIAAVVERALWLYQSSGDDIPRCHWRRSIWWVAHLLDSMLVLICFSVEWCFTSFCTVPSYPSCLLQSQNYVAMRYSLM